MATVTFTQLDEPERFRADLVYPGGETAEYTILGDEWELNARVIRFKPLANMLGYDSVYKLDRFYGRFEDVGRANETNGFALFDNPGLDVHRLAQDYGTSFGIRDAAYGSGVYNPMADGLSYDIYMTQDALIARPANAATRARLGDPSRR